MLAAQLSNGDHSLTLASSISFETTGCYSHWHRTCEPPWILMKPAHDGGNIGWRFSAGQHSQEPRRQRSGTASNLHKCGYGHEPFCHFRAVEFGAHNKSATFPRLDFKAWRFD